MSKLQKEFTQLLGFKSPEKALNTLRGRYRGEKARWEDMPIQYLNLWVSISRVIDPAIYTVIDPPWGMVI